MRLIFKTAKRILITESLSKIDPVLKLYVKLQGLITVTWNSQVKYSQKINQSFSSGVSMHKKQAIDDMKRKAMQKVDRKGNVRNTLQH